METLFKRGDTRADGFRFCGYEKRRGKIREKWLNPVTFQRIKDGPYGPRPLVAWIVSIDDIPVVTFAASRSKAKMNAVQSYWNAYGYSHRSGFPNVKIDRAKVYDNALASLDPKNHRDGFRACYDEKYIMSMR